MYIPLIDTLYVLDENVLTGTKREILEMLLDGPMTAQEMSKKLKIQINAVREHLASLENGNLVTYNFVNTKRGRPKRFIKLQRKELICFLKGMTYY